MLTGAFELMSGVDLDETTLGGGVALLDPVCDYDEDEDDFSDADEFGDDDDSEDSFDEFDDFEDEDEEEEGGFSDDDDL